MNPIYETRTQDGKCHGWIAYVPTLVGMRYKYWIESPQMNAGSGTSCMTEAQARQNVNAIMARLEGVYSEATRCT